MAENLRPVPAVAYSDLLFTRYILPAPSLAFGALLLSLFLLTAPVHSQSSATNDGFQRRDGAMYIIRNGVKRPMTHDVHLPNGRVVTRDGFVVERDGKRTELAEGKGCTLAGTAVGVKSGAGGQILLAAAPQRASARRVSVGVAGYLQRLGISSGKYRGWGPYKKGKHGKGKRKKHGS